MPTKIHIGHRDQAMDICESLDRALRPFGLLLRCLDEDLQYDQDNMTYTVTLDSLREGQKVKVVTAIAQRPTVKVGTVLTISKIDRTLIDAPASEAGHRVPTAYLYFQEVHLRGGWNADHFAPV